GGRLHIDKPARADGGGDGPTRLADIHDAASGDVTFECPGRLQFDLRPGGFSDRSQIAVEVVHREVPFRRRIESEPSAESEAAVIVGDWGRGGGSSRKSTVGEQNIPPVTAVEKSRMRSVLPRGSPRNMLRSICSVTHGVREYPMK